MIIIINKEEDLHAKWPFSAGSGRGMGENAVGAGGGEFKAPQPLSLAAVQWKSLPLSATAVHFLDYRCLWQRLTPPLYRCQGQRLGYQTKLPQRAGIFGIFLLI